MGPGCIYCIHRRSRVRRVDREVKLEKRCPYKPELLLPSIEPPPRIYPPVRIVGLSQSSKPESSAVCLNAAWLPQEGVVVRPHSNSPIPSLGHAFSFAFVRAAGACESIPPPRYTGSLPSRVRRSPKM